MNGRGSVLPKCLPLMPRSGKGSIISITGRAFGSVYRATHKDPGFTLAIKEIQNIDDEDLDELEKEIAILKKCKNPNIVSYFGTATNERNLWVCSVSEGRYSWISAEWDRSETLLKRVT